MSDYETYQDWKKWNGEGDQAPWRKRMYDSEFRRAELDSKNTFLEVGFGNGDFLRWAKDRDYEAVGLEVIPELVEWATKDGFEAYCYNLIDEGCPDPLEGRQFDCILAFDVIEHFTHEEALKLLSYMKDKLSDDGSILLRFPNGESPFSIPIQNGDMTHKMYLAKAKLNHLCLQSGLNLFAYRNAARISNRSLFAPVRYLQFLLRDIFEICVGYLMFNFRRPLDPVATAVLKKAKV